MAGRPEDPNFSLPGHLEVLLIGRVEAVRLRKKLCTVNYRILSNLHRRISDYDKCLSGEKIHLQLASKIGRFQLNKLVVDYRTHVKTFVPGLTKIMSDPTHFYDLSRFPRSPDAIEDYLNRLSAVEGVTQQELAYVQAFINTWYNIVFWPTLYLHC